MLRETKNHKRNGGLERVLRQMDKGKVIGMKLAGMSNREIHRKEGYDRDKISEVWSEYNTALARMSAPEADVKAIQEAMCVGHMKNQPIFVCLLFEISASNFYQYIIKPTLLYFDWPVFHLDCLEGISLDICTIVKEMYMERYAEAV